jgi:hypothetical protein
VNAAGIERLSNAGKTHRPHNGRSDFVAGTAPHAPFPTFAPMVSNGSLGGFLPFPIDGLAAVGQEVFEPAGDIGEARR